MDSRKRKPISGSFPPSPSRNLSIFRDISNCKTPKQPSKAHTAAESPQFFTTTRNTPVSSSRKTSALKSNTARRLKAFELEQSKSARKALNEKEKSLKSLSRSLTVWLNFLFENPSSCGCDPLNLTGEIDDLTVGSGSAGTKVLPFLNGKRASGVGGRVVDVDGPWRGPKRQRESLWSENGVKNAQCSASKFSKLRVSLQEICSFEDLKERMRMYLSLDACTEIFETMSQLTKNIDEGRIKMRASCPIVSDVGMKEKVMRILMSYNPVWLRIGLYVILGGENLFPDGDVNSEQETAFLRMIIEKQFLSHIDLAKAFAYNKMVEGLYRPGYYEKLGNVILKRFFLLVIILDRAKSSTSLPLRYGIDGLDGGSPLLFSPNSNVKSSCQVVTDFLSSEVMHGEGNLLAHLSTVGFKVNFQQKSCTREMATICAKFGGGQYTIHFISILTTVRAQGLVLNMQSPLSEYDFTIKDLFDDLQDGTRFCRAIQLLTRDSSILMKLMVPANTQKKSLGNCGIALQYLNKAGTPLVDEDGTEIAAEDLVNGDKELTLALLWNMFVHLQLPRLLSRSVLSDEISNIRGVVKEITCTETLLDLLLTWIQAVCGTYNLKVENHSSLLDGKAMWCLLDYYFRKEQDCPCSSEDSDGTKQEVSIMSAIEYTDAVHNFLLSQKLTSLLGNFPEVLQVSDVLEHKGACNAQTVLVLLVFLSVQLLVKRNVEKLNFHKLLGFNCQSSSTRRLSTERDNKRESTKDFKAIMAWWQDMVQQNGKCSSKPADIPSLITGCRKSSNIQRENAATTIQSHFRRYAKHRDHLRIRDAALVLQGAAFALLSVKKKVSVEELKSKARGKHLERFEALFSFMVDRHNFVNLRKSTLIIQRAARAWIGRRYYSGSTLCNQLSPTDHDNAATVIQSCIRGWSARSVSKQIVLEKQAATIIQQSWRKFVSYKSELSQHSAATKIQSHYHGWLTRKNFASKKQSAIKIQRSFRCLRCRRVQILRMQNISAIVIQSHFRGWMARIEACKKKNNYITMRHSAASKIQSYFRGWMICKSYKSQKQAGIKIQRSFRYFESRRKFQILAVKYKSIVVIQSHFRGWMARREACKEKSIFTTMQSICRGWLQRKELLLKEHAARRIQGAFHCRNLCREYLCLRLAATDIQCFIRGDNIRKRLLGTLAIKPAIVIQSHFRGWMSRRMAKRENKSAILIQAHWKGYLARKDARDQLLDLRLRMQKSAANIDDNKRLINRLVAAVSELLSMRSVTGILHTCATLDVATELSQKCCEALVDAGAVGTLLKLIRSVSRSVPDQQVLKHALSTLRNLAHYPHLTEILVGNIGCVEAIFLEFLKNKEEGYFIASELLKKICASEKGGNIMCTPAILKRLKALVDELARKAVNEKKNARNSATREHVERRWREANELLQMVRS